MITLDFSKASSEPRTYVAVVSGDNPRRFSARIKSGPSKRDYEVTVRADGKRIRIVKVETVGAGKAEVAAQFAKVYPEGTVEETSPRRQGIARAAGAGKEIDAGNETHLVPLERSSRTGGVFLTPTEDLHGTGFAATIVRLQDGRWQANRRVHGVCTGSTNVETVSEARDIIDGAYAGL